MAPFLLGATVLCTVYYLSDTPTDASCHRGLGGVSKQNLVPGDLISWKPMRTVYYATIQHLEHSSAKVIICAGPKVGTSQQVRYTDMRKPETGRDFWIHQACPRTRVTGDRHNIIGAHYNVEKHMIHCEGCGTVRPQTTWTKNMKSERAIIKSLEIQEAKAIAEVAAALQADAFDISTEPPQAAGEAMGDDVVNFNWAGFDQSNNKGTDTDSPNTHEEAPGAISGFDAAWTDAFAQPSNNQNTASPPAAGEVSVFRKGFLEAFNQNTGSPKAAEPTPANDDDPFAGLSWS